MEGAGCQLEDRGEERRVELEQTGALTSPALQGKEFRRLRAKRRPDTSRSVARDTMSSATEIITGV